MEIKLNPIATIINSRKTPTDDFWGEIISEIRLCDDIPTEAFDWISDFSHLEILYFFDKVDRKAIQFSGRPRGNPDYPKMGIFSLYNTTFANMDNKGKLFVMLFADSELFTGICA